MEVPVQVPAVDRLAHSLTSVVITPVIVVQRKARGAASAEMIGTTVVKRERNLAWVLARGVDVG